MNKTTEALKLAEALENDAKEHREVSYGLDCPPERTANWKHALNCEAAARLIREALAEPVKQEPEAWMWVRVDVESRSIETGLLFNRGADDENTDWTPLYAAPVSAKREWVDLTDYEIFKLGKEKKFPDTDPVYFSRAVIAAFKEKNK